MSVSIDITYLGNLRCEATHGPSGARLLTDAPKDNQGEGAAFAPTDLVATSLGSCILTIMGIAARRHDIDLRGATAHVEKHMLQGPERRIDRLEVLIKVPVPTSPKQRKLLERTAHACPVERSLLPATSVDIRFEWAADSEG